MFRTLFPIEDSDSQPDSVPIPSAIPDPRFALLIVCIVIAIERFCFHVLFSLYTLFQMAELGQTEAQATLQFGVFTSIMYFTPIVGGPVADRAGRWPGILVGIALLALGYLAFGFGLPVSVSLSFLAFGMGLFKGNITTIVGTLVPKHERDAAYSRFYWAVNLGALPSGFVAGWLCASYGFRFVFLFCCAGMALLLPIGILCRDSFREAISVEESAHHDTSDRERIITILTLLPIAMLFFCAFYQSGTSLTLFAKNSTREALAGFPISPPAYQSLQPALVLILSPVLVRMFRCWPLRTWHKLLIGMGLCLLSCLVMVFASLAAAKSDPQRVSPLWLIGSYFLISIGELCFSPIGFSLVSKLSPSKYAGLLMGLWMAAIALGNLGTGFLGILWERWSHPSFFLFLTGLSALAIPLLWSQRHRLDRVLGGRHD